MSELLKAEDLRSQCWTSWVDWPLVASRSLLVVETGGTTGRPVCIAYTREDFQRNFVEPFLASIGTDEALFRGPWLYAGPTGPHAIGHAADACAEALSGFGAYRIDLDSRWLHKLEPGVARERYLSHVIDQCLDVFATRPVSVLFSTPPLLRRLAEALDKDLREAVSGIHWGGVPATAKEISALAHAYPSARLHSGFGNSLVGLFPELGHANGVPIYGYAGGSHGFEVLDEDGQPSPLGEVGWLSLSRKDACMNFRKLRDRDRVRVLPLGNGSLGFQPVPGESLGAASHREVIY